MSQAPGLVSPASPPRCRRWPWLLLPPSLLLGVSLAYYFHARATADRELAKAVAETDRLDPDWRMEAIESTRKTYVPEENAAETVLAAYQLLPSNWPNAAGSRADPEAASVAALEDRTSGLPPEMQLDAALARDLRAELSRAGVRDALAATEKFSHQTRGRFSIVWGPTPLSFDLPCQHVRPVVTLLRMQAELLDEDGQADDAFATLCRMIVAGRSIGDEPTLLSQLLRISVHHTTVQATERALAQGLPSAGALAETQRLLTEDASEPLLLYAFRGERANQHHIAAWLETGASGSTPHGWRDGVQRLYLPHMARRYHAAMLRICNRAVEAARLEPESQAAELQRLEQELPRVKDEKDGAPGTAEELLALLMPAFGKVGDAFRRDRAVLRGAIVALALERYRLERGDWPSELKSLVPAYLPAVPLDPFDGQAMRYRRLPDGVIVYSVGPDGQDDGGAMNRKNITAPGTDLCFRLWDVASRRQAAAELLPIPDESDEAVP
jgi:hypothetical protein